MAKKKIIPTRKPNQIRLSDRLGTPALLEKLKRLVDKKSDFGPVSLASIIHNAIGNEIKRLEAKAKNASRKTKQ